MKEEKMSGSKLKIQLRSVGGWSDMKSCSDGSETYTVEYYSSLAEACADLDALSDIDIEARIVPAHQYSAEEIY